MKKLSCILFLLFFALQISAQLKIADLFREMPDSLLPLLTKNNRLDMIDFCEAQMKSEVKNKLEGTSEITQLSNDSMQIRLNDTHIVKLSLQNALEPYDSCQQIICREQIFTLVSTNEEETIIDYYSVNWNHLLQPKLAAPRVPRSTILRQDDKYLREK